MPDRKICGWLDPETVLVLRWGGFYPYLAGVTPHRRKITVLVSQLLEWFPKNARDLPWRRTRDPYAIWVSEIMLQQTRVQTVIPFWERWLRELPTIEAAATAPAAKIHKLWEGLGYYSRVRNLQKAAQQIVAQQSACRRRGDESQTKNKLETPHVVSYKFPEKFDDMLALPGIGRYTAGAIGSIAFNQPVPILDGNAIRVLTRIFGRAGNPREKETNGKLWEIAEELVSHAKTQRRKDDRSPLRAFASLREDNSCSFLNQSLMELGALVCTPRNPQCAVCPVRKLCVALRENRVDTLPNLGQRTTATARRFVAFVVERNGKFLVRQRPAGVVNAHLWEFPNAEAAVVGTSAATTLAHGAKKLGLQLRHASLLCTVKHSITRHRITLEAFTVRLKKVPAGTSGVWKTPVQMRRLAFTAAHKKIVSRLK